MAALPKVRPISDLRIRGSEVLEELSEGPVILALRGHAAAVLVSLDAWNRLIERLEDAEDALEVAEARQSPGPSVSLEEYMRRRGESVPG
jgi:prevent-host-death family protein